MPLIDYILSHLGKARFLSKLDLLKGFHQVPLAESSRHLTAFYKVMPFGLCNAPATFQLLMQRVLSGLEHCLLAYIDDVVIFSDSFQDHLTHISDVLGR